MTVTLHTDQGRATLRFERELRHGQDRVWRAITDPTELKAWFPSAVVYEPRVGAPMTFDFGGKHGIAPMPGEVLEWDPPRAFAFMWGEDTLRFELAPAGEGTLLVFTHAFAHEPGKPARDAAGWEACFEAFDALLEGESKRPGDADWSGYYEGYVDRFGELSIAGEDGERRVRLRGPLRELDGRPAIDVVFDDAPGVLVVRGTGDALGDGAGVEVRDGSVDEPGERRAEGVLRDPLAPSRA
ncbi:MAG TPA: SRPBCC family protein [Solirubrobacteraceae bacterium]|jgi:uncharacterized protein YndB with AHSA1/START domain|nr:SRPBCC family protein [Solirubrobacteraceae bacterium]